MIAVQLIIGAFCGIIAAAIASSKGRSTVGWFFGGFFFGLIGIIIVACLSNVKEDRAHREQIALDNRRLREKLEQERIKSEAFRQHVAGRLDVHDEHLGIETRSIQAALPNPNHDPSLLATPGESDPYELAVPQSSDGAAGGADQRENRPMTGALAPSASEPAPQKPAARQWFYEQDGQSRGPVLEHELQHLFRTGRLGAATLVWTEPIGQWVAAKRVNVLKPFLTP